ncbi:VWA domain-containing protein [Ideonella livida]|uniref:VWA domain-containing protein n=1 Tax=Ideonella livida TaxID=2707176 RepID=A0A7C9PHW9_9BURK|nr:VWA domain-containing protein [Ideonella livida]NDY91474.1 VWA domain-containing protein [Ideonella livida]
MEEWIGQQWHRLAVRAARTEHPHAAVLLSEVERPVGLLFRAGGGPAAVRPGPGAARAVGGPRGWWQRVAGTGTQAALAQREHGHFSLPPRLAVFEQAALNRLLYLWLAALGAVWDEAVDTAAPAPDWIATNRQAGRLALQRFPGLAEACAGLVAAQLALRPALDCLRGEARHAEARVQQALRDLGLEAQALVAPTDRAQAAVAPTPEASHDPAPPVLPAQVSPVWLWLAPPLAEAAPGPGVPDDEAAPAPSAAHPPAANDRTRRRARRIDDRSDKAGLMMFFRAESLLSWGEFVKVHRAHDDDPDSDAARVADDLEELAIAQGGQSLAARVRFDLDLPSAAADDRPLGPGEPQPEWDWRRQRLLPDHCAVQRLQAASAPPFDPPAALRATARRVRRRLECLRAAPAWQRGLPQGEALDLDAWVRHRSACAGPAGQAMAGRDPRVFAQRVRAERSLATLLLADLSQSTDAHVWTAPGRTGAGSQRVIDVIRDALYVFGEALAPTGDAFEMLGFSSVRRQHVRVHELKAFDDPWNLAARARVGAIKPGYYTRMGAAVRHATARLSARPERQRLLLLLTDGKPNDLDHYEGRHGLEDTRHAVQAARRAGLTPFCLTIDEDAHDYLPYLFGQHGYCRVHQPAQLVQRLSQAYAALTRTV